MFQAGVSGLHKQGWRDASGLTPTDFCGYSEVSVGPAGVHVCHIVSQGSGFKSVMKIITESQRHTGQPKQEQSTHSF